MIKMQLLLIAILAEHFLGTLSQFSNLETIEELKKGHDFGGNATNDEEYNFCIENILQNLDKEYIFGPFQKAVMEMSELKLSCSPCRYSSRPDVQWVKLTFENQSIKLTSDETYTIQPDDSLLIKTARFEDFGSYYCLNGDYVGYIWSLEVEAYEDLEVVKARRWSKEPKHFEQMSIFTTWEAWSDCNKCNDVGKRHRLGYCIVQGNPTIATNKYKALDVYRNGISCNLFLHIHPNVDEELLTLMAKSPILMLGFCKISCDYFTASPADIFARLHPKIHEIYLQQVHGQTREYYRDRMRQVYGITPGKPTTFEAVIIFLLLLLEIYIVVHVWRNRGKAM